MARKIRIEIKLVMESGTIEYRHAKGDEKADGTLSEGPTEKDFEIVNQAILGLVSAL